MGAGGGCGVPGSPFEAAGRCRRPSPGPVGAGVLSVASRRCSVSVIRARTERARLGGPGAWRRPRLRSRASGPWRAISFHACSARVLLGADVVDQGGGAGRRGPFAAMRDEIGDALVGLVADPRDHRHAEVRRWCGPRSRGRTRPDRCGPRPRGRERRHRRGGGPPCAAAAATSRSAPAPCTRVSTWTICQASPLSVSVSSTSASAALPAAVTRPRRSGAAPSSRRAVAVEEALDLEELQHPVALVGQQPQGVGGVDVVHLHLESPLRCVELESGADADAHPVDDADALVTAQEGVHPVAGRRPQHHGHAGRRRSAGRGPIDQVEVDVALAAAAQRCHLAVHPEALPETGLDRVGDGAGQLRHGEGAHPASGAR